MPKGHKLSYKRKVSKPFSEEHLRKMSLAHKGKRVGVKNPMWKDEDEVSYRTLHQWVVYWKGSPETCEGCGKSGLKAQQIQWANKDHKYRKVLEDYIRLCAQCHYNYDSQHGYRK